MNPAPLVLLLTIGLVNADNLQLLSAATTDFSQRLYQKLAVNKPSSVYSPYSIHSALSMTSLGARGETATQFSQFLGLTTLPGVTAHQTYHDLILQLNSAQDIKLHTANALYLNPNIPVEAQFVADAKADYLATVANFDLAAVGGPEKAINDFVSDNTKGLIQNIVPKGAVTADTVTVLVNTIFFNGTWQHKFAEASTRPATFHKLGGVNSQVSMMNTETFINIKRNVNGADVAELPFVGNRFSLYIALPHEVDGITALETSLTSPGKVDELFNGLSAERVSLSIPKFKIESTFDLTSVLPSLGLTKPFDIKDSNFQGISTAAKLAISGVLHKAVIEVKETGTVAAAATAIIVGTTAVIEPPPRAFIADHPFVFFLRDKQTDQILFQGKFTN